jgi:UMP-CMP kinase
LYLDCPLDTCYERLLKRSESSNRTDDQRDVIKKRFLTFQQENEPVLNALEKVTKIVKIDSSINETEVLTNICNQIEGFLDNKNNNN